LKRGERMSKAVDDSQYLARTLAITLLDLQPAQKHEILSYLHQELERLTHVLNEDVFRSDQGEAETEPSSAENNDLSNERCPHETEPHRRIS
jgi:hypothetical protein